MRDTIDMALEGCAQYFPHVPDIIRNKETT